MILEASALHFARYQSYTQINVGYMPFSRNKLAAIFRASEPELRTGLLFELYFYHDRWKQVSPGDVLDTFAPDRTDLLKGYTAVAVSYTHLRSDRGGQRHPGLRVFHGGGGRRPGHPCFCLLYTSRCV